VHMGPPSEAPKRAARVEPTASRTALRSCIRCSIESWSGETGSDRPVPRLSSQISRLNEAIARSDAASAGSSHWCSQWEVNPATKTRSGGPSPTVW
jgi:hypothetical protein